MDEGYEARKGTRMVIAKCIALGMRGVSVLALLAGCYEDALPADRTDAGSGEAAGWDGNGFTHGDGVATPDLAPLPCKYCDTINCTDTSVDRLNCGNCGNACARDQSCRGGACGACIPIELFAMTTYVAAVAAFPSGTEYISPVSLVVADLNLDGKLDLATAEMSANHDLGTLINKGGGVFTPNWAGYLTPGSAASIALADLDGDGQLDYVLVKPETNTVATWIRSDIYALKFEYHPGMAPSAVAAADVNADHHPDLIVANAGSNEATVLLNLNDGRGKLSIDMTYATGKGARSVVAADWNGDGKPDFAVADAGDDDVAVFLNKGAGAFAAGARYGVGKSPWSIMAADLDGDGTPDLVVANHDSGDVSVLLNQGAGKFAPAVNYPAGSNPQGIAAGDINGDGVVDLAVAGGNGVAVLFGQRGGGFAPALAVETGGAASSVGCGDFDADGRLDLAVTLPDQHAVGILMNRAGDCE